MSSYSTIIMGASGTANSQVSQVSSSNSSEKSAAETFKNYMSKSTEEKFFIAFLNGKKMTEEEFDALPQDEQQKLLEEFKQQMRKEMTQKSGVI